MVTNVTPVKTIVLLGGESSGKTTLGQALSAKLNCPFVPEYGRYLFDFKNGILNNDDFAVIAKTQLLMQNQAEAWALQQGVRYVVCDTSPLTTFWYSVQMTGRVEPELSRLAQHRYDYTVLCSNDIPFIQDGTRKDQAFRDAALNWYQSMLLSYQHLVVAGDVDYRCEQVVKMLTGCENTV